MGEQKQSEGGREKTESTKDSEHTPTPTSRSARTDSKKHNPNDPLEVSSGLSYLRIA